MTFAARERMQVRVPILGVNVVTWLVLILAPESTISIPHCVCGMRRETISSSLAGRGMSGLDSSFLISWELMLISMMLPLLIAPVRHVRQSSLTRRRVRAIALFVAAYTGIWTVVGIVLQFMAQLLHIVSPRLEVWLLTTVSAALMWQLSPVKQLCLNRCHSHPELAAFGLAADIDSICFGLTRGLWCVGSCWPLMLLCLLVPRGHLGVMALLTIWLASEQLDKPAPPRWCLRFPVTATRMGLAQARLRLARLSGQQRTKWQKPGKQLVAAARVGCAPATSCSFLAGQSSEEFTEVCKSRNELDGG